MADDQQSVPQSALKHREAMHRALANSIVEQLIDAGCEAGELIDFASEVLKCIMDRGFGGPEADVADPAPASVDAQPVALRVASPGGPDQQIHGPRIVLRRVEPKDRALLERWSADEDIRRTFSSEHLVRVLGAISTGAQTAGDEPFVIRDESGRDIGMVCLFRMGPNVRQAEMTKLIGEPSARGRGYAGEATKVVLAYAFDELKLRRVFLKTAGFNIQNIKLNEKVGFRFEGILRQSHVVAGRLVDVALMSILSHEFRRLYCVVRP